MRSSQKPNEGIPILSNSPLRVRFNCRHTLALLGCLGLAIEYCQRVNLSVAIVAMVHSRVENTTNTTYSCPKAAPRFHMLGTVPVQDSNSSGVTTAEAMQLGEDGEEFSWDKWTQGLVLASFYWGYAVTSLIGGRMSEYLGGKMVVALGISASSFMSLITPLTAYASVQAMIGCRICLGAAQGLIIPAMYSILSSWFLPEERNKYTTIVFSGFQIGTVTGMTLSGWLANSSILNGWPLVFYCFGAAGLMWLLAWCLVVHNHPENQPGISRELLSKLQDNQDYIKQAEVVTVPWRSLATSLPLWGVLLASLGGDFGLYTLINELPTYLHDVQNFDVTGSGILSALPFLLMLVWSLTWGVLMQNVSHRNILSLVTVRRISMATAYYGVMAGLLVMMIVQCKVVLVICMICLMAMVHGMSISGYLCSLQDLAPNFAGTLMGLSNTCGAIAGITSPILTGYILEEIKSEWSWRIVFLICAVLYFVTCTFYLVVISAKVQPWNEPPGFSTVHLRRNRHQDPAVRHHLAG